MYVVRCLDLALMLNHWILGTISLWFKVTVMYTTPVQGFILFITAAVTLNSVHSNVSVIFTFLEVFTLVVSRYTGAK